MAGAALRGLGVPACIRQGTAAARHVLEVSGMTGRLVTVVLTTNDLDRAVALYRDGFGLDLHVGDHAGDDQWTSGRHAATSWTEGAYIHFAIYESKDGTVDPPSPGRLRRRRPRRRPCARRGGRRQGPPRPPVPALGDQRPLRGPRRQHHRAHPPHLTHSASTERELAEPGCELRRYRHDFAPGFVGA